MEKISKNDIKSVQGGGINTDMRCSKCGHSCCWRGNYMDGKGTAYECPMCHQKSLVVVAVEVLDEPRRANGWED